MVRPPEHIFPPSLYGFATENIWPDTTRKFPGNVQAMSGTFRGPFHPRKIRQSVLSVRPEGERGEATYPPDPSFPYAHIKVVVAKVVVNFFGLLVITRYHDSFEGRH